MITRKDLGIRVAGEKAVLPDEFVTLGQLIHDNSNIVINQGDIIVSPDDIVGYPIYDVVLSSDDWITVGALYEYTYTNEVFTNDSIVHIVPHNDSVPIVNVAEIYPQVLSFNGEILLFARNKPNFDIIVDMVVMGKTYIKESVGHVDGGNARSIYLPTQRIDGGGAWQT